MKVLHIISIAGIGGAEKLLIQLLPALNERVPTDCLIFHHVDNGSAAEQIASALRRAGTSVTLLTYKKVFESATLKRIARFISEGEYTVVHSHLKYSDAWLAWLKFRNKLKIPVVSTMHGYNDEYENKYGFAVSRKLIFSPYYLVSRWMYRQLDGFVMISNIVSEFFRKTKLIKDKYQKIIYHGYALQLSSPKEKITDNSFSIAIPGRLLKRKGHLFAIEAMEKLLPSIKDIRIDIYGEGPERSVLESYIKEKNLQSRVVLHGYINDLPERLRNADVVVIPSLWEGFGLVFLDAFAAGTPVIAFNLPAANEIIHHRFNGLLATPYSSASIAANIQLLYENAGLKQQIVRNASIDLEKRFSMKIMVDNYIDFYEQVSNCLTN